MEIKPSVNQSPILHYDNVGILHSHKLPDLVTSKLKAYSEWKVASVNLTNAGKFMQNKHKNSFENSTASNSSKNQPDSDTTDACPHCKNVKLELNKELIELYKSEKIK